MSGEHRKSNNQRKPGHLDQFPQEKTSTPWERAVLEKARRTALHHYTQRRLREQEKRRDELFWQKFGAYEASEISKRRQNRNKKSPTRLERYEQLDEERNDRHARHNISGEDILTSEERLKRRAERFGLEQEPSGKIVVPSENVEKMLGHKSLADYAETLKKLERRRARFAMEPREDFDYEPRWRSDVIGTSSDPMDEARMLARKKRFAQPGDRSYEDMIKPMERVSQPIERRNEGQRRVGRVGRGRDKVRGRTRRRFGSDRRRDNSTDIDTGERRNEASEGVEVQMGRKDEEFHSVDRRQEPKDESAAKGVEQQWERDGEEWPDQVDTTQEWEATGESWDTVDMGDVMESDTPPDRGTPPDRVDVREVGRDDTRFAQRWEEMGEEWPCQGVGERRERQREGVRSGRGALDGGGNERDSGGDGGSGRGLQSWEASGETW